MHLNIDDCFFEPFPQDSHPSGDRVVRSLDSQVEFQETVSAGGFRTNESRLILEIAQRIGWAFDWDVTEDHIEICYKEMGKKADPRKEEAGDRPATNT